MSKQILTIRIYQFWIVRLRTGLQCSLHATQRGPCMIPPPIPPNRKTQQKSPIQKRRIPSSQLLWHDKDPALPKGHACKWWASVYILQYFTENCDIYIWMQYFLAGVKTNFINQSIDRPIIQWMILFFYHLQTVIVRSVQIWFLLMCYRKDR